MSDPPSTASNATMQSRETPVQIQRLVDWNSEVLLRLLKQIVLRRISSGKANYWEEEPMLQQEEGKIVLDEVTDVIDLPGFSQRSFQDPGDMMELPLGAELQLREYVAAVANAYHSNPFHCLQHASQVTMAVTKLLSRIVVRELDDVAEHDGEDENESDEEVEVTDSIASHLHNHTYGITSDPLTQFALVLSALIHAVDHGGIPNPEAAKEDPEAAALYKNRSIIEQRSVDKAWKKLMEPEFRALRQSIYADETELKRFRQVVVNSVLATDIDDEELQSLRRRRWETTFRHGALNATPEDVNRKATIVIEHLMQASDIFHTMQPWIVFEKWSIRLFEEMYAAFKNGRSKVDPSLTWYRSELEFFDNYAIPLAMQLKDCDAFVVSSDEYLNYALKNRHQWAAKGKDVVASMIVKATNITKGGVSPSRQLSVGPIYESRAAEESASADMLPKHKQRLVDWNVEMLLRLLRQIVATRVVAGNSSGEEIPVLDLDPEKTPIDEVSEIVAFAEFDASCVTSERDADSVELSVAVASQLRDYVTDMSSKFKDNPFHCIDHGSLVCMTTRKLLSRIVSTVGVQATENHASALHNRTFGISSDPLAQFAVVFAALIHDVDHGGVPNGQLVRESSELAEQYKGESISEQHSIDLAWGHLMQPCFEDLRSSIFSDESELKRFRQIIVNAVMATDCINEQLVSDRKARWEKAFVEGRHDRSPENTNRKATVVIEMLMQTADIFHTVQNWHIYSKWNERLFQEMYQAYQAGRLLQDPSIFWYKSELLFFDEHVIPVAKQMTECDVFGDIIAGDDYLSFALSNRQQWAAKGGNLVASMMARFHGKVVEKARAKRMHRRMSLSAKQA